jgi:murein DD-endopeptidase MepM/ murein hydrolase activator NlpD
MVGHSGKATRDELHFEIRQDNHPVDPADLLPKEGKKAVVKAAKKSEDARAALALPLMSS